MRDPKTSPLRLLAAPSYVLLIGLVCSAAVALNLAAMIARQDADEFAYSVEQNHGRIESQIQTYVSMLESGAAMLAAVDLDLSQAEFSAFAERLDLAERYPGVLGVGYTVRVRSAQAGNLIRSDMRAQGARDFRFWPETLEPGVERHAILYLEPLDARNQTAIGFNMFSDPVRRAAMERARDTGRAAASGAVELVQEITDDRQSGFLIYVPVYEGGDPGDAESRRERLTGFVYSPFRADDLMAGVFARAPDHGLFMALYDGASEAGQRMHLSPGADARGGMADARFSATRTLDVAGRPWTIVYAARPDFAFTSTGALPLITLLAGVVVTLAFTIGAFWQARTSAIARRRTQELEVFNTLGAAMVSGLELEDLVQRVTDAGVELTGAQFGAFFYNRIAPGGESYTLYTISGVPREAFSRFPMPRNTKVFAPTFSGERVVRARDITQTQEYGQEAPHHGMPAGHLPVRSYLAAPVVSRSGAVLGGLFFGHARAGVFSAHSENLLTSLASQAAIAIDSARMRDNTLAEIEHRKLLLDELNHRVKNTLATVQSMAAQTIRGADSLPGFREAFESRLIALSSTHNLLTRGAWKGASLRDLLAAELRPYEQAGRARVTMEGPDVRLRPAEATSLGMAFHELTTNAVKYGALSTPEGRVAVAWEALTNPEGRERLRIVWREHGGPAVEKPKRRGFGSRLIERGLVGQHQGEARLLFEPAGLVCTIEIPLVRAEDEQAA